ncbi:hypothetical protein RZS28_02010 [Methylocapsa polymorpha]|uniref:Uncharacterized protein n=1 Tax=Methylocapsa polymorpha TaxID=3080828 RepID=A0ABZ0HSC0_9HYPH|nr:hypothetical protein RZS28_02010 [Methylocapsa sp. RX1]
MAIGVALIVALTVASIGMNGAPSAAGIGVFINDRLPTQTLKLWEAPGARPEKRLGFMENTRNFLV